MLVKRSLGLFQNFTKILNEFGVKMNLRKILVEMGISSRHIGNQNFDTLGKINHQDIANVCSYISDEKYLSQLSKAVTLVITTEELSCAIATSNICIVDDPKITFFLVHNYLCANGEYSGKKFSSKIDRSAKISELSHISSNNVIVGKNAIIEEFVSIKSNVIIGDNVIIRAGTIIGGEGFEQKRNMNEIISVSHVGGVIIQDNVEIQQNCSINKAIFPWDNTIIKCGCKLADMVQIAHGVVVGKNTFIAASTCVNGNVDIEENVWIGPGCVITNAVAIGANSRINIGSIVTTNVQPDECVSGNFAINHEKFISHIKAIR